MARIRSIKPEFWTSAQVMAVSRNARLLFIGIWNFADDGGRCPNSAKSIRAQVFPGDDDVSTENVRRWIDELSTNGLLRQYEVDGATFLQVTGWHHQKIDRPRPSRLPPPPLVDHSTNARGAFVSDPILSNPIRSEGSIEGNEPAGSLASARDERALASQPGSRSLGLVASPSLVSALGKKGAIR